jgi:hypothetical protein
MGKYLCSTATFTNDQMLCPETPVSEILGSVSGSIKPRALKPLSRQTFLDWLAYLRERGKDGMHLFSRDVINKLRSSISLSKKVAETDLLIRQDLIYLQHNTSHSPKSLAS